MDYKDFEVGKTNEHFWFKAKRDLIDILMKMACNKKKKLKILNIGAGTGHDLKILNRYGINYVIDIEKKALSFIEKKLVKEKKLADACDLPYKENFFDIAVSFDVFEHIKNDKKAISEVNRVLKKGGKLVFTVPAHQFLFSNHDKALDHFRRYSKNTIKELFGKFNNIKLFYWNSILFLPIAITRLMNKNAEKKVDKGKFSPLLNKVTYNLMKIDNFLIRKNIGVPIGISLVGFCEK